MQTVEDLLLQVRIEINQEIATGQQVHVRNGSVERKIAAAENYQPADLSIYPQ